MKRSYRLFTHHIFHFLLVNLAEFGRIRLFFFTLKNIYKFFFFFTLDKDSLFRPKANPRYLLISYIQVFVWVPCVLHFQML